jgi:hypothetical protein
VYGTQRSTTGRSEDGIYDASFYIYPDLLENLDYLEEIEGCDDVDNVTDDNLEAWMKKSLGEVAKLATTDDVAAIVPRKLRMNMSNRLIAGLVNLIMAW